MAETKEVTETVLEETTRLYEAMFLVDSAQAGSDWDGTLASIILVLERADAEVVSIRKWADRKLAYEIDHKGRGTYILAFFKTDPLKIASIEKDVNLSEKIARVLVLTTEGRPEDVIKRDADGESKAPSDYVRPGERPPRRDAVESPRAVKPDTSAKESAPVAPEKKDAAPGATSEGEATPEASKAEAPAAEPAAEAAPAAEVAKDQ